MSRICGILICTKLFSLIGFFILTMHHNPAVSLMPKVVYALFGTWNIFTQSCKPLHQKCPVGSARKKLLGCETVTLCIFLVLLIHKFYLTLVIMELKFLFFSWAMSHQKGSKMNFWRWLFNSWFVLQGISTKESSGLYYNFNNVINISRGKK